MLQYLLYSIIVTWIQIYTNVAIIGGYKTQESGLSTILWNCQNGVKYESKKQKKLHPRAAPKIQSENKIDFWCFNATFSNISAISWRPF